MSRTILPIPEPEPPTYTELDVRQTQPPPRFQVTAPEGAPNVVIIMIDDLRVEPNKRTKNFIRLHRALKFGDLQHLPAFLSPSVATPSP